MTGVVDAHLACSRWTGHVDMLLSLTSVVVDSHDTAALSLAVT